MMSHFQEEKIIAQKEKKITCLRDTYRENQEFVLAARRHLLLTPGGSAAVSLKLPRTKAQRFPPLRIKGFTLLFSGDNYGNASGCVTDYLLSF